MKGKTLPILMKLLMMSPLLLTTGVAPKTSINSTQINHSVSIPQVAETNLSRVTWSANSFPNSGVESWDNPHSPSDIYTTRTTEGRVWTESTNVYEGSHSVGMQAKAVDVDHRSDVRVTQMQWIWWSNPLNTTLDFDYYIDEIGNPIDADYFLVRVEMSSHTMNYYIGSEVTGITNGTYGYFFISSTIKTWNHFHTNLTRDYIDTFSSIPTDFRVINWYVRSYTTTYTRVFMDDVNLINSTNILIGGLTKNGNFEGSGSWYYQSATDPADISQSSVRYEGNWSMNMTAISNIAPSHAYASVQPEKLLTEANQGHLSFWWRINDWMNSSSQTMAQVVIQAQTETDDFYLYYYLCLGGSGQVPAPSYDNEMNYIVTGFNVTNTWNFFDRNIWTDFSLLNTTENVWISEVEFQVINNEDNSQLTVLFDDIQFTSSIMNDMGYEHQNAIDTPIEGWGTPPGSDSLTVTDFAFNGNKAANLTLADGQNIGNEQAMPEIPLDENTELILDFNVYIDSFNQTSEDYVLFYLEFNEKSLAYVIANSSSAFESWLDEGDSGFILLQSTIITGEWLNFQLVVVHDYESLFGNIGSDALRNVYLAGESGTASKLTVFFDDVYIYYDPAPTVSRISHYPESPEAGGSVIISATAIDATLETVEVNFRVNNGAWTDFEMSHVSGNLYQLNITELLGGSTVDYSITAVDAFGKTTVAMNGTDYFTFTVGPASTTTQTGNGWLPILVGITVVIIAIGVVMILYIFVYKKR